MGVCGVRGQLQGPGWGALGIGGGTGEGPGGGGGAGGSRRLPRVPPALTVSLPVLCRARSMVQIVISR